MRGRKKRCLYCINHHGVQWSALLSHSEKIQVQILLCNSQCRFFIYFLICLLNIYFMSRKMILHRIRGTAAMMMHSVNERALSSRV